jgi:hypothetical protein
MGYINFSLSNYASARAFVSSRFIKTSGGEDRASGPDNDDTDAW